MGIDRQHFRKDFYPLEEACKIASELTSGEEGDDRPWSYVVEASTKNPDTAAIAVYDEDNELVGYWYT